jgi:DNA polymerase-3 subunit alpha
VKNVGQAPVDLILASRRERPFDNLNDFARRVDLRQVGKRALESLVKVGALDRFGPRTALLDALDRITSISSSHFRAAESGQLSLFGADAGVEEEITLPPNVSIDKHTQLNWERELIGLYITDHPLQPYMERLQNKVSHYSTQLADAADKETVIVAGLVSRFRPYQTKSGKEMGFVTIEDIQGFIELVLFPNAWKQFNGIVDVDAVVCVEGKVDAGMGDPKVLVDRIYLEKSLVHSDGSQKSKTESTPEKAGPRPALPAPIKKTVLPPASQIPSPLSGRNIPQHVAEPSSDLDDDELPPPPNFDDDWSSAPPPDASASYESWKVSKSELTVSAVELPPAAIVEGSAQVSGIEAAILQQDPPFPATASNVEVAAIFPPTEILDTLPVGNVPVPSSFILGLVSKETTSIQPDEEPRMVIITIQSSGDKIRDVRRLRRIHGMLVSCPGKDHFTFHVHENNRFFLLDFPNESIGLSSDLLGKLVTLVGENNVRVETIRLH